MNTAIHRGAMVGVLLFAAVLWLCCGQIRAADEPKEMKPIPEQPMANGGSESSPFQEEAIDYEDEDCADYCGLPLCSPPGRVWLRGDYLMWWTSGMNLQPLVTTSPQGTPRTQAGVLPGATVLSGNETVANDGRSGFRTTIGMWLDACHVWGVEGDYLNLGQRDYDYSHTSTGNPILARPYYDVENMRQASELVAYPDVVEGTVMVSASDYFHSAGIALTRSLCGCDCCGSCESDCSCGSCGDGSCVPLLNCCRVDLLVGYRYYGLYDDVTIREELRQLESPFTDYEYSIRDSFRARNDFHGVELGLRNRIHRGRWSLDILTKVAIGNNHRMVNIAGQTAVTAPGQQTVTYNEGILAGPTTANGGTHSSDAFTMIPQLGVELGYQWNCHWRSYVGYNILYWGCVQRAADQINLYVDPRNFPPTQAALPFPTYPNATACFWAQGVNVGLEYRF